MHNGNIFRYGSCSEWVAKKRTAQNVKCCFIQERYIFSNWKRQSINQAVVLWPVLITVIPATIIVPIVPPVNESRLLLLLSLLLNAYLTSALSENSPAPSLSLYEHLECYNTTTWTPKYAKGKVTIAHFPLDERSNPHIFHSGIRENEYELPLLLHTSGDCEDEFFFPGRDTERRRLLVSSHSCGGSNGHIMFCGSRGLSRRLCPYRR